MLRVSRDKSTTKKYKELNDDEYIWCDKCQEDWKHHCPNCGPLVIIKDNPAEKGDPCYAKKTLPDKLLKIRKSRIHALGVFAKSILEARLRFGPYKGRRVELEEKEELDASYTFEIRKHGQLSHLIDAKDVSCSNWTRYINCARDDEEENLKGFQYKGRIYFRTKREIKRNEELLVWYGDEYGKSLGIFTEMEDKKEETRSTDVKKGKPTGTASRNRKQLLSDNDSSDDSTDRFKDSIDRNSVNRLDSVVNSKNDRDNNNVDNDSSNSNESVDSSGESSTDSTSTDKDGDSDSTFQYSDATSESSDSTTEFSDDSELTSETSDTSSSEDSASSRTDSDSSAYSSDSRRKWKKRKKKQKSSHTRRNKIRLKLETATRHKRYLQKKLEYLNKEKRRLERKLEKCSEEKRKFRKELERLCNKKLRRK